ncbi:alpha/beta hydrolase [Kitasatospora sp. NBC_00240]|uniref:alpha/beta hydrolase n=1 Tax=Kitasatospora sp. NBC_00240 TaxID=2903567 RepID=UPI0022583897|nr:alpha/beta hydrolase [Kitasatospora sp. NBC_00240]MCX5208589.1 alpha/beta hydrolase [Kitasatospora sp. NBC_00240]
MQDITRRLDPELLGGFVSPVSGMAALRPGAAAPEREDLVVRDPLDPGAPPVPVRIYRPTTPAPERPAVLFVHGGGFTAGERLEWFDPLCDLYAEGSGAVVVSVGYRLAPRHPYPAARQDCLTALNWLRLNGERLAVDGLRVAVAGSSSGAAIAAGLTLALRDRGGPLPSLLLLHAPVLDDRHTTASSRLALDPRTWNRTASLAGWGAYLHPLPPGHPDVPAHAAPARAEDLSGLPPVYLSVGDLELSRDEVIEFGLRLARAGVPLELHVFPGAYHGFDIKDPQAAASRHSLATQVDALRRALHPGARTKIEQASSV